MQCAYYKDSPALSLIKIISI